MKISFVSIFPVLFFIKIFLILVFSNWFKSISFSFCSYVNFVFVLDNEANLAHFYRFLFSLTGTTLPAAYSYPSTDAEAADSQ